ncbi:hypothetical protein CerSpe_052990 [Prunus speciosa]
MLLKGYSHAASGKSKIIWPRSRQNKDWDFEIKGYFPDEDCSIVDSRGNTMAQELMASKDLYHVVGHQAWITLLLLGSLPFLIIYINFGLI